MGWENWAGNQTCETEPVVAEDIDHLKQIVAQAAAQGKRIRVAGGSYSWSEVIPCPEVIVDMRRFDEIKGFDEANMVIEAEAGVTIEQLSDYAEGHGMTLITPTLFPHPTVGGAVATGCHGTSFKAASFSDQLVSMKLVKADGTDAEIFRGDPDWWAATVALGTLGVIVSVRLKVEPQFSVYVDKRYVPVKYVLEEFQDLQNSYEFLEIFWFPLQDKMWLYLMDRTSSWPDKWSWSPLRRWWEGVKEWWSTTVENVAAGWLIPWLAVHAPQATPILNRIASHLSNEEEVLVQTASDAFHYQKSYPKNWDLSYAVPADKASEAWRAAIDLVWEYADAELYPANLALHCRFTNTSESWLSPDFGRKTLYIEVTTAKGTPPIWHEFFKEMERRWIQLGPARPHWGKLNYRPDRIKAQYPRIDDFLAVREAWDPKRVFLNHYLEFDVFQLDALPIVTPPTPPTPPEPPPPEPPGP